jgi:tRNA-splicing ligase RtcB
MKVFGEADDRTQAQMRSMLSAEDGARGVLCADNHLGYGMPIGGVVAYRNHVSPNGVGFDIACGNCAVRTDVQAKDVDVSRVMDEIFKVISFGLGRSNGERIDDHPVFEAIAQSPVVEQRAMVQAAQQQLGTVGSGNHYVDLFEDREDGRLWVGVHFGSRGFGHKTASGFLAIAAGKTWGDRVQDDMDAPPAVLRLDTPAGQDYLAAMEIAGQYAYAGRNWVVDRVLRILGASDTRRVHNHHNFAWFEEHGGERLLVIRKGATPAFPGQQGFIGGSMGDDAVIVEGVDSEASAGAL